jgi:hypothetical protein
MTQKKIEQKRAFTKTGSRRHIKVSYRVVVLIGLRHAGGTIELAAGGVGRSDVAVRIRC